MAKKKQGYEAGKVATLTPAADAVWVDDFNKLLETSPLSRNLLTQKLIEDALKDALKSDVQSGVMLQTEGLTDEQIGFLETEQGQHIVLNLVRAMFGQSANLQLSIKMPQDDRGRVTTGTSLKKTSTSKEQQEEIQPEIINVSSSDEQMKDSQLTSTDSGVAQKALARLNKIKRL